MATDLAKKPVTRKPAARKPEQPKPGVPLSIDAPIGVEVRDRVSGFAGIAICKCWLLNGNVQFGLQPKGEAANMAEAKFVDFHLLEEIGKGVSADVPPVDKTVTLNVGDVARDTVTGLKGTIIERIHFQNGCVYFIIQPKASILGRFIGEMPDSKQFMHQRLAKVIPLRQRIGKLFERRTLPLRLDRSFETKVLPTQPAKIAMPQVQVPKRPTGGPTRSVPSARC